MFQSKNLSRRSFLNWVGAAAAFMGAQKLASTEAKSASIALPAKLNPAPRFSPRALPKPGERIHDYQLDVVLGIHTIVPKINVPAFLYNGTMPGPQIRVKEGDWVRARFTNKTTEFHTIHWHGVTLSNEMDGVPFGTQWPVGPGQTFEYLFRAQPAGTHFYHCHNMTPLHVQAGMFGALIIEPEDDPIKRAFPYTREYTLALSEIDTVLVEQQMEDMARNMGLMNLMNRSPKLMQEMNGRMMGWFKDKSTFLKALDDGYIPPYAVSKMGENRRPNFNFFLLNGKSFPMTEPLLIRSGESIRVRLIGAGSNAHFMHLHGHDFWHVCQDGHPLPVPIRLNTIAVFPGNTSDIIIQGTNPGNWHFHDHSDTALTNNGIFPGGMMTMLMYEDAANFGINFPEIIQVGS